MIDKYVHDRECHTNGRWDKIQINIVGSLTDREQLCLIETVAKVFVIEERMKDLTYDLDSDNIITDLPLKPSKKSDFNRNFYNKRLPILNVRGFNWNI